MGGPSVTPGSTPPPIPGGATISPPPATQQVSPPPPSPMPGFSTGTEPIIQAQQPVVAPSAPVTPAAPSGVGGSTIAFNSNDSNKNQGATIKHGGKSKLMPVFMGLGIVIFLLAYTFVWVFVFKLKIPGLPF